MHNQMSSRDTLVNSADAIYRQNVTGRWTRKLVGTVRSTHSNGQSVNLSRLNELSRLFWVSQHLVMGQLTLSADAILFASFTRLK